jgi:hypothetical protein
MITLENITKGEEIKAMPQDEFFECNAKSILNLVKTYDIKTFIEVGAYHGRTAEFLLKNHNFDKYFVVDNWNHINPGLMRFSQVVLDVIRFDCFNRLSQFNNVSIIQGCSWKIAEMFHARSVDAVFIDACHDEECVVNDILAWNKIPKKLFFGDDFYLGSVQKAIARIYGGYAERINNGNEHSVFWKIRDDRI